MTGTDRAIRGGQDIDALDFGERGLLPVVAQDAASGAVLMVAWANRDAVTATLESGDVHFWSRSRDELWRKGETSGNTLSLVSLHADCDGDTLLALVRPLGPSCHTGERTCFGAGAAPAVRSGGPAASTDVGASTPPEGTTSMPGPLARSAAGDADRVDDDPLDRLDRILRERASERPDGSYTVRLLDDRNLRLKKLGEETAELVAALATGDRDRSVEEAADLLYHLLVALRAEDLGIEDIRVTLGARGS